MLFKRINPSPALQKLIECYWIIENEDLVPHWQKIIPDGFPEIIFHYKDPYRICLVDTWEQQPMRLLGGQISKHFFLENTGVSGMIGIKLRPAALTHLFNLDMQQYTDKVIDLSDAIGTKLQSLEQALRKSNDHETMIALLDQHWEQLLSQTTYTASPVDKAVDLIFAKKGMITVAEITTAAGVGERQLERLFKQYIGLSPKFYARVIRFSTIFECIQQNDPGWAGLAYEAGYYDQSHFIRNFKAFTGEDPSRYGFDKKNMANFFLNKK